MHNACHTFNVTNHAVRPDATILGRVCIPTRRCKSRVRPFKAAKAIASILKLDIVVVDSIMGTQDRVALEFGGYVVPSLYVPVAESSQRSHVCCSHPITPKELSLVHTIRLRHA